VRNLQEVRGRVNAARRATRSQNHLDHSTYADPPQMNPSDVGLHLTTQERR